MNFAVDGQPVAVACRNLVSVGFHYGKQLRCLEAVGAKLVQEQHVLAIVRIERVVIVGGVVDTAPLLLQELVGEALARPAIARVIHAAQRVARTGLVGHQGVVAPLYCLTVIRILGSQREYVVRGHALVKHRVNPLECFASAPDPSTQIVAPLVRLLHERGFGLVSVPPALVQVVQTVIDGTPRLPEVSLRELLNEG